MRGCSIEELRFLAVPFAEIVVHTDDRHTGSLDRSAKREDRPDGGARLWCQLLGPWKSKLLIISMTSIAVPASARSCAGATAPSLLSCVLISDTALYNSGAKPPGRTLGCKRQRRRGAQDWLLRSHRGGTRVATTQNDRLIEPQ